MRRRMKMGFFMLLTVGRIHLGAKFFTSLRLPLMTSLLFIILVIWCNHHLYCFVLNNSATCCVYNTSSVINVQLYSVYISFSNLYNMMLMNISIPVFVVFSYMSWFLVLHFNEVGKKLCLWPKRLVKYKIWVVELLWPFWG